MYLHVQHRYEAKIRQAAELDRSYSALAKLINCDPEEIAIVTSCTTAWFQACRSLWLDHALQHVTVRKYILCKDIAETAAACALPQHSAQTIFDSVTSFGSA